MKPYVMVFSLLLAGIPQALGAAPARGPLQEIRLGALPPESAHQGWGALGINQSVQGHPLRIGGRSFSYGLGTHANSKIVYELDGTYQTFAAQVGLDSEMEGYTNGSVVFQVFGDGRKLFDSRVMRIHDPPKTVHVSVAGIQRLKLVVTDAGDGINCDHADWADAVLWGRRPVLRAKPARYSVVSPGLTIELSADGEIVGALVGPTKRHWAILGESRLGGCRLRGNVRFKKLPEGGYAFTRTFTDRRHHRCVVTDRFIPTPASVHWELNITSDGSPWSTAIETRLKYPVTAATRFWTAWSDPEHRSNGWRDPLVPRPFADLTWPFSNLNSSTPVTGDFIALPLVTVSEPAEDTGLSLVLSPKDTLLNLWLSTTSDGMIQFSRTRHRLGEGKTVRFGMDLTAHEAGWRGGLRWMVASYPRYFNPPNPMVDRMAGCGAYSGDENPINVAKFKRMAFRINWKLSDDFPYMGMFIPPVTNAAERWGRSCDEPAPANKPRWTSGRRLNDYARYMRTNGFYVLDYFNVTEFGKNMTPHKVAPDKKNDPDLWKDPYAFLKLRLPHAVLFGGRATAYGASVVDVGDPAYRSFMLEQARRYNRWVPDASGICIDRLDWLAKYNPRADDGVSWVDGKPARALTISWKELMGRLGPLMHRAHKVIFVNPLDSRLDLLRHVDGIYTEFGQTGPSFNASALMGLRKPVLAWTYKQTLHQPNPDAFFQRHLLLGVYPTVPYPWNNHCIQPDPQAEREYLAYGPLLDAMRGKKWVLAPHCVESSTPGIKVNLFKVFGGYALPVTFGAKAREADVRIRNLPGMARLKAEVLHPGRQGAVPVPGTLEHGVLELRVPLVRGCGMVRLTRSPEHPRKPR